MRRIFADPGFCLLVAIALYLSVLQSSTPELWATSIFAFVAALVALGWLRAPPVLVWLIAINMLTIWADIGQIELNNNGWVMVGVVANLPDAIVRSSCAIAFLAIGMRCGLLLGRNIFGYRGDAVQDQAANAPYSAKRIALAYFAFLPISVVVGVIGQFMPGLSQPVYAFGLLKFALIYLLAARVFASGRDTYLLMLVIVAEMVNGSIGGWASYKEGFFVVMIALMTTSRRLTVQQVSVALAGVAAVLYLSLGWTAVKKEFRRNIVGGDVWTSLTWLADKYFGGEIDLGAAAVDLLDRIGYNKFYAMIIDANTESLQGIYYRALVHIVTPRALFPDKAVLDDSAQTAQALGWSIADDTSIGLGYVAQAHIDFGFPGLLAPMILLGAALGAVYAYFLTRPAPPLIREAFAVACLFNALRFEANFDKQLGGLIWAFLVLAAVLRFGGASLGRRLVQRPNRQVAQADFVS
ncbi:MAG: hypothetical protein FJX06_14670 [Alphaproteobacteria bacterium]|nr:hypothetical protein [Alphaproteobacteria bacterium]